MEKAPLLHLAFAETVTAVTSVHPAGVLSGVAATDSRPPASQASAEPQNGAGGRMFSYERGLPQGVGSEDNEERGIRNLRGRLHLSRPATVSVGCCSHRPWTGAL